MMMVVVSQGCLKKGGPGNQTTASTVARRIEGGPTEVCFRNRKLLMMMLVSEWRSHCRHVAAARMTVILVVRV